MVEVERPVPADGEDEDREWEAPECPFPVGYGDRLDVPYPWWFNRRIALRVLFDRIR